MNNEEFDLAPEPAPESNYPIRFELAPNDLRILEGASAVVREALIPFVVWSNVPVRVLESRRLGYMEAFLLEAGVALGRFGLVELEDVTSVPAKVIAASASKLLRQRTFVELAPGVWEVDEDRARLILDAKHLDEEHRRMMTFIYFPRQDEVTADEEVAGRLLQIVKKLRAPRQAPVPAHVDRTESVRDFIARRIAEGRILGVRHTLLGVDDWSKPPSWPNLSPCYYGRGHVRGVGTVAAAEISVWGYERRKAKTREYQSEKVKFDGTIGLVQEWLALSAQFSSAFGGVVEGLPTFSPAFGEPLGPCEWRIGVSTADAAVLAADRWLPEPVTISVCSPTAKVDVRVSFEPMDAPTAELFVLDGAAMRADARRRPHSDRDLADDLRMLREQYPLAAAGEVTRVAIEDRLWKLKRFVAVYQLRANEDFAYG